MAKSNWKGAAVGILIAEGVGFLGGLLSGNISDKYLMMVTPPLSPPGWVFAVIWPVLYALMGYASYRIYDSTASRMERKDALYIYGLQLALNFIWPILFFGMGLYWAAVVTVIALAVAVAVAVGRFGKIDSLAGKLLIPYLIWIIYATYLTIGVAILN